MILMFLGTEVYPPDADTTPVDAIDDGLTPVLQLPPETLVAVVEMLRVLELLYRVKAEVEAPALDVVLIELRQLLDAMEEALEPSGRPLRVLLGEMARDGAREGGPSTRLGWEELEGPRRERA